MASPGYGTVDYVVFSLLLLLTLGIGIFFAFRSRRRQTTSDFLLAGRKAPYLPVALSYLATFESSIMMLGKPSETYVYGVQWFMSSMGFVVAQIFATYMFVPMIYRLNITSIYEYLEVRFKSRLVRLIGAGLGILQQITYIAIVIFVQSLTLEAAVGMTVETSMLLSTVLAVVYTSLGGMKAVIWTDVFQCVLMFIGMIAIIIRGCEVVGGGHEVMARSVAGGRMNFFNFDPDPTVRHTFWGLFVATIVRESAFVFSQSSAQRVSSTSSETEAKKMMLVSAPAFPLMTGLALLMGLVAYAYYDKIQCDPFESGQLSSPNQIILLLVKDLFWDVPGMSGVFLASLFSAALSTISSSMSSFSANMWRDFLQPLLPTFSEKRAVVVAKLSVVVCGVLSCAVAYCITSLKLTTLPQIAFTIFTLTYGPLSGMFLLAALCPWANDKGVVAGVGSSIVLTGWIFIGTTFSKAIKTTPWLPAASTAACFNYTNVFNTTVDNVTVFGDYVTTIATTPESAMAWKDKVTGVERLYLLSYTWYGVVAIAAVMSMGSIVSLITGGNKDDPVDPRYLATSLATCCGKHGGQEKPSQTESDAREVTEKLDLGVPSEDHQDPFIKNGSPPQYDTRI
ncbi:sodium-dependent multivitamin transporter-like [Haliotis rubra]|uniref:sodium-dependent multivitamin transporter-like n=1 Tax=Haliotis rubra TaxID=36100 RepID=UPI001EE5C96A|nr:sodium-dependent multivitamin transporter-like [Haliotis rubra]XP_046576989.1 sodium-dependent multivitamin transporter-like [Haliotis rubra]